MYTYGIDKKRWSTLTTFILRTSAGFYPTFSNSCLNHIFFKPTG